MITLMIERGKYMVSNCLNYFVQNAINFVFGFTDRLLSKSLKRLAAPPKGNNQSFAVQRASCKPD